MKKTLQLQGLDCAACAAELEREIAEIDGISSASIAFVNQKLTLEYDTDEALQKAIYAANHFEEVRVLDENDGGMSAPNTDYRTRIINKKRVVQWACIGFSALFFITGLLLEHFVSGLIANICTYVCFAIAYFSVGYPVLISTVKNIVKGKIFDENFLMTVASIGAMCLGEFSESVLVMLLYQIGETLQEWAVDSSRRSLVDLMELKSESATVFRGREQITVKPEEVAVGEIVFVKAGEKVPVDGVVIDRAATLDVKSLTGEAEPRTAQSGEELLSGSINVGAAFTMRAIRPYSDSAVGKILDMVENASSGKAAPEKFITKFARWYTPIVCIFALALAVVAPLCSGFLADGRFYFKDLARWVQSALTFLVISCPCALIISVPLTYFSGIGACAKAGILVKGATHLDTLSKAKTVAFDKTGTLTKGIFSVREIHPVTGVNADMLVDIVAAVEKNSSHPIAKAFANMPFTHRIDNATERAGFGMTAEAEGEELLVGNAKLLLEKNVAFTQMDSVYTVLYVAKNGEYLGCVEVGDTLREETQAALSALKNCGVRRQVMLTGDNARRAEQIASEIGLEETYAELLPMDKLQKAESLKKEGALVYVGDGINDAPVMTAADCSVSMGKLGSAAAIEASDFVLITDDLRGVPQAVFTAKKTKKIVMQNIVFSIVAKAAFMILGAMGILPLWAAVFADVGIMLLAVANSFRVRRNKKMRKMLANASISGVNVV
ncbi:MAG: cadmium-translocating P-type ATPase [Clostridia bacterium]|nr:cadmium-translocating P-type ATPase [Clostridia bacterium]